jgi:hypothetical protein
MYPASPSPAGSEADPDAPVLQSNHAAVTAFDRLVQSFLRQRGTAESPDVPACWRTAAILGIKPFDTSMRSVPTIDGGSVNSAL